MKETDPRVVVERRVSVAPSTVFEYFRDAERWKRWQGVEAEIQLEPGGIWRVNVTGDGFASGRVTEVVQNQRIVFTWGWEREGSPIPPGSSRVSIDLIPDGEGTLIRLTHSGLPPEEMDEHRVGWGNYIGRLVVAAEGSDPGEDPLLRQ